MGIDRLEQGLTGGEMAVERADPDPGPASDLLQRGRGSPLGERIVRGHQHLVVVALGVRALGAGQGCLERCLGGAHLLEMKENTGPEISLDKWRVPPYSSGGCLQ